MKHKKLTFLTSLPDTLSNDPVGFFEAFKLAGLEDKFVRLSVAVQRRFFGRAPFGKKEVMVRPDGQIRTRVSCAFGHDWDEQYYRFDHLKNRFYQPGNEQWGCYPLNPRPTA